MESTSEVCTVPRSHHLLLHHADGLTIWNIMFKVTTHTHTHPHTHTATHPRKSKSILEYLAWMRAQKPQKKCEAYKKAATDAVSVWLLL